MYYVSSSKKELKPVTDQEVNVVVDSIAKLVTQYYVSLAVGEKMSQLIRTKNKRKAYKNLSDPYALVRQLTTDLRSINGDLHMSVHFTPSGDAFKNKSSSPKIDRKGQWSNYGFQEIKVLDGNIGYLKINHFTNWNHFKEAKKVITATFNSLKNTDALIIDVRNNRGGFEAIVAYLISYLFDGKPIHLSDYYYRYADKRHGIWTSRDIPGKKMPKVPVYVLVNSRSASAAESLAYMLKHLKRAVIIGETTSGAGNGAMTHKITSRFSVSIASETTINAVTKTSFEQVGVIPHIKTSGEEAFTKGYMLALEHLKTNNAQSIPSSYYENALKFLMFKKGKKDFNKDAYKKYVGSYKSTNLTIVVSVNNVGLFARIIGKGSKLKLTPGNNHTFLVGNLKQRIQFVLNKHNEVTELRGIDSPMKLKKVADKK